MTQAPNTPANMPTNPDAARSFARITRPILTLGGARPKTEAEIIKAAQLEAKIQRGEFAAHGPVYEIPSKKRKPRPIAPHKPRPAFALDYSFQRRPITE